jgi:hypothetical protein
MRWSASAARERDKACVPRLEPPLRYFYLVFGQVLDDVDNTALCFLVYMVGSIGGFGYSWARRRMDKSGILLIVSFCYFSGDSGCDPNWKLSDRLVRTSERVLSSS